MDKFLLSVGLCVRVCVCGVGLRLGAGVHFVFSLTIYLLAVVIAHRLPSPVMVQQRLDKLKRVAELVSRLAELEGQRRR